MCIFVGCVGVGTGYVYGTCEGYHRHTHSAAIGRLLKVPNTFLFQDFNDGASAHYITSYPVQARHCHKLKSTGHRSPPYSWNA